MANILIDTGVFVALFDKSDFYHTKAVLFIKNNRKPLITTLACVTEAMFLLNHQAQIALLNWLHLARIDIAPIDNRDLPAIGLLIDKYADVPMDFADACLVHLANIHRISHIATIDSDFHIYRLDGKYPFRVIL